MGLQSMIQRQRQQVGTSTTPPNNGNASCTSCKPLKKQQGSQENDEGLEAKPKCNPFSLNRSRRNQKNGKKKISKAARALLFPGLANTTRAASNAITNEEEDLDLTETASSIESIASSGRNLLRLQLQQQCQLYQQQQQQRSSLQSSSSSSSSSSATSSSCSASLPESLLLVNLERCSSGIPALHRSYELDALAAIQVDVMMANQGAGLQQSSEVNLRQQLGRYWGENVGIGDSINAIHQVMMMDPTSDEAKNIVDPHFHQMGIATAKANDGQIYLCQLFRG